MSFLMVEGLSKRFGGLTAVSELDFTMKEGEIIGIIGPNGSGKTTALNLITGFLKPNTGKVTFRDENITGYPRYKVCQKGIARTFQLVKPFLDFTALQNVVVGRAFGREPNKDLNSAREESMKILEQVGLSGKSDVLVKNFTVMQRKRLELARALATRPYLLLLDEFMAGLNHAEAADAMKLIKQIRDSKVSIVVVEHIMKAILGLSDRIIVLNMGKKITEASPNNIVKNPKVIEIYLGKSHA